LSVNLADLINEIRERDERDSQRATAPLRAADDALMLDSTQLSIDEVYSKAMERVDKTYS
jgi:cytidylate kinase